MIFSSLVFVFYFLPVFFLCFYTAPRAWRFPILTVFSYVFYGWANPYFVVLMAISTLIAFWGGGRIAAAQEKAGQATDKPKAGRGYVVVAVVANLAILGFFKYFNFGIDSWNALAAATGAPELDAVLRVVLPLGISFYTFHCLSYTIDVYRGDAEPSRSLVKFAAYVSMFPQLVAGPIIRYKDVAEQILRHRLGLDQIGEGAQRFSIGLAKKVLLANPCGYIADAVFDAGPATTVDAWIGLAAYTLQIYYDFSAYSDMAIGLGLMCGFRFLENFEAPYKSKSITEFWRRWHISLSNWLRDYLYVGVLGGNRHGAARVYLNLFLTMLLGGLWHGAAWTFVIWGAYHGTLLAFERATGKTPLYAALPSPARVGLTVLLVMLGWVLFRAASFGDAVDYYIALFGAPTAPGTSVLAAGLIDKPYYLVSLAVAGLLVFAASTTQQLLKRWSGTPWFQCYSFALLLIALLFLSAQGYNPFIYFIF